MPEYDEIYKSMTELLLKNARTDMAKNDREIFRMMAALAGMRERLLDAPSLPSDVKEQLQEYFTVTDLLADAEQRHLYLQGARDFTSMLRELGVIK